MSARSFLFTSESVTEGHPDKMADQISDTILDAVLAGDPGGRVACETLVTTGLVVVAVSHATRALGSSRMIASRMASDTWSHILSGWPSVTDSDVNRYWAASTMLIGG